MSVLTEGFVTKSAGRRIQIFAFSFVTLFAARAMVTEAARFGSCIGELSTRFPTETSAICALVHRVTAAINATGTSSPTANTA